MQKLRDLKNAQAGNSWFWVPWILPHIGGLVTLILIQILLMIYMCVVEFEHIAHSLFECQVGALVYQFMVALHHP